MLALRVAQAASKREWLWEQYVQLIAACLNQQHEKDTRELVSAFFSAQLPNVMFLASTLRPHFDETLSSRRHFLVPMYEMMARSLEAYASMTVRSGDPDIIDELHCAISGAFQAYPLMLRHLAHQVSAIERKAPTSDDVSCGAIDQRVSRIEHILKLCIEREWDAATSSVVFGWLHTRRDPVESTITRHLNIQDLTRLALIDTPAYRRDLLHHLDSGCIYFFTHVILVMFEYGDRRSTVCASEATHAHFSASAHTFVLRRCAQIVCNLLKAEEVHTELVLEVGACLLLVAQSLDTHPDAVPDEVVASLVCECIDAIMSKVVEEPTRRVWSQCTFHSDLLASPDSTPDPSCLLDSYHTIYLLTLFLSLARLRYTREPLGESASASASACTITSVAGNSLFEATTSDLLQPRQHEVLIQRLRLDGVVLVRGLVPTTVVQDTWARVHAYASQRHASNQRIALKRERRRGGFLVDMCTGHVYGDEAETDERHAEWRAVCEMSTLRQYVLSPPKGAPLSVLLNSICARPLVIQSALTWLRVKLPGEDSCLHSDYFHFLESGTLFAHKLADTSASTEYVRDACRACGESLGGDEDDDSDDRDEANETDEVEEIDVYTATATATSPPPTRAYNVQCDLCLHMWHGSCVPYVDLADAFADSAEWHCRRCVSERLFSGTTFTCWMPLQEIDAERQGGMLEVWPGTHHSTLMDSPDASFLLPKHLPASILKAYPDLFPSARPSFMNPGDALLFDIRTIHSATVNRDPAFLRMSMDVRIA